MFVDSIVGDFFMPFFVAKIKHLGGKQNAKLQTIKTALTGKINVSGITF